jgi:hypothetical protein
MAAKTVETASVLRATATLEGVSPISFSKVLQSEKLKGEKDDAYDLRCWRERMHTVDGEVVIPGVMLKNAIFECAKFMSEKIAGKGNQSWTKHFESGILVTETFGLGIKAKDVPFERVHCSANGIPGGGKRVWKHFPIIDAGWRCGVSFYITDATLVMAPEKVHEYLRICGQTIGMGRWRARRGGLYGRFRVLEFATVPVGFD